MKRSVALLLLGLACIRPLQPVPPRPPSPPSVVTALSLNLANGAGDEYRSPTQRAAQRRSLDASGADLIALREVDSFVLRSASPSSFGTPSL